MTDIHAHIVSPEREDRTSAPLDSVRRILIFRPGSLGDTVVALPCFHLIARRFPGARRLVLTNSPRRNVSLAVKALLDGSGLVDDYLEIDYDDQSVALGLQTIGVIRDWKPDLIIHMAEPRRLGTYLKERAFFQLCGARQIIGMARQGSASDWIWLPERQQFEHECERLARSITELGDARLSDLESWSLRLSDRDREVARDARGAMPERFVVCAAGTAMDTKDWGAENWTILLRDLGSRMHGWGLAMVGSPKESERAEIVRSAWPGASVNLCGRLSPRESAAAISMASLYLGHDTGPMHLAAASGVPCVAIFSARERPGIWFPYGQGHLVVYHSTPCSPCHLDRCVQFDKECIRSISVREVATAVTDTLKELHLSRSGVRRYG